MTGPGMILRELHRLRRFARDLQTQIEQGPQKLKAQQTRVARQEEILRQARDEIKQLKVSILDKESSHKTTLQQISKYEKQQNESTGKKEYDALQHEIDAARKKLQQIEDEILEAMGQTEEQTAKVPELEKAVTQVRQEAAQYERDSTTRLADMAGQLQQTQQQLTETEATLPIDIRNLYTRQIAARGDDALSAVVDRTCVACYTAITAQNHNDLLRGNFVACKSCGRILYLPE